MFWTGHMDGWGWVVMTVGALLFWGLLVVTAVLVARSVHRPADRPVDPSSPTAAEQVLGERFARGEIDEDEYRRRQASLRSTRSHR